MRKLLRFADGHVVELSPISYREFMVLDLWYGASDMAYAAFLMRNNFEDPCDYNDETLNASFFYLYNQTLPDLLFNLEDDVWTPYSEIPESRRRGEGLIPNRVADHWKREP